MELMMSGYGYVRGADDTRVSVGIELTYTAKDAFAVTVNIYSGREMRSWTLSRDMLMVGQDSLSTVGMGDVRIRRVKRMVELTLDPHDRQPSAVIVFSRALSRAFLAESYRLVPSGEEVFEVDVREFLDVE